MPDFQYTVRLNNGHMQKGSISASNRASALSTLRDKQMQPIVLKEATARSGLKLNMTLPGSRVQSRDLVMTTRQFAVMVNAGVPILRSLNILKVQTSSVVLRKVLEEVISDVEAGGNLSDALEKHPKVFSTIYVSMVRAGETGGILDKVLDNLAIQLEKEAALKSKIRGALTYPAVILTVTMIAFYILMTFIVPKIGAMLTSLSNGKEQLPIYTRILLSISHILKQPSFIITVIIVVPLLIVIFRKYTKTKRGRYQWHYFLLKIPVVNVLLTKTAIARFSRVFASLMSAGVSIVETIDTTAGAIGNDVIAQELIKCSKAVKAGKPLSAELAKSKYFPPIVPQMLSVGEETGETDTIIIKIAEFYEEEVDVAVGALSSILEPVMILLLGGIVGLIAISVFGPITKAETAVH